LGNEKRHELVRSPNITEYLTTNILVISPNLGLPGISRGYDVVVVTELLLEVLVLGPHRVVLPFFLLCLLLDQLFFGGQLKRAQGYG
jgi:hypothetical protein